MKLKIGDRVTFLNTTANFEATVLITDIADIIEFEKADDLKILKIERPIYEKVKNATELLTEEEKEFIRKFIKFANFVPDKIKVKNNCLLFFVSDGTNARGLFEFHNAFKNLPKERLYTLKELGLE